MSERLKAADAGDRVKEAADRIKRMREASNDHDGGYPATDEGRRQSLSDHAAVAEWAIFHSGWDWEPPDTSLEASIERLADWAKGELGVYPTVKTQDDDLNRVIDAARKYAELELSGLGMLPFYSWETSQEMQELDDADPDFIAAARKWTEEHTAKDVPEMIEKILGKDEADSFRERIRQKHDPDGVGEGWRLLRVGEMIRRGDQFEMKGEWYATHDVGLTVGHAFVRRRRRIEQAEQGGASTATASEVTNEKVAHGCTDETCSECDK